MLIIGGGNPARVRAAIANAVERGEISEAAIDESCRLVAAIKSKYAKPVKKPRQLELSESYQEVSRAIANGSVTLVRDSQGLIPLSPSTASVCAIFFVPPRFAGEMVHFSPPLLAKGASVQLYNSRTEPSAVDEARALRCAQQSDITVVGSFQWAAKPFSAISFIRSVRICISTHLPWLLITVVCRAS